MASDEMKFTALEAITENFQRHGISISNLLELAKYINEAGTNALLEKANSATLDEELLARFIPFMDGDSLYTVFLKILNGELSPRLLPVMLPYYGNVLYTLVEAAVMEGAFGVEVLTLLRSDPNAYIVN